MLVLVTRAAEDVERTAAALGPLGHEAVSAPVIAIRHLPVRWPAARPAALVATSHHAFGTGMPSGWPAALPLFAVGRRTGAAARAAGWKDVRIGTGGGGDLAALVALTLPRPGPLLHLAARDRKPDLGAALDAAGYHLDIVETYAAEPNDTWPAPACDALRQHRIGAALHFSRRSADLALALAHRHDVLDPFLGLHHACLSADAAESLMMAKARSVAVARQPDEAALLALLPRP